MKDKDFKAKLMIYRLLMFGLAAFAFYTPIGIWLTSKTGEIKAPFHMFAFSQSVENSITGVFALIALIVSVSMFMRSSYASYFGTVFIWLEGLREIMEAILTYGTKKHYPGPKWSCIGSTVMMIFAVIILTKYFFVDYPKTTRRLDEEKAKRETKAAAKEKKKKKLAGGGI